MGTQVPIRLKRESGENPEPALGCDRGRKPHMPLGIKNSWEGAVSRLIRKSEDLPDVKNISKNIELREKGPQIFVLGLGSYFFKKGCQK